MGLPRIRDADTLIISVFHCNHRSHWNWFFPVQKQSHEQIQKSFDGDVTVVTINGESVAFCVELLLAKLIE
jgi:hypothetical protein